jgi:iron complex transport system ATP-binding protein
MSLIVRTLNFRRGERLILDAVDLAIEPAGITAVLGPNGAGKSTLLACIAGLLEPDSGQIELNGQPIATLPLQQRARHIAFLPQTPEIAWPIDVATLVGLGRIPFAGFVSDADNAAAVQRAMQRTDVAAWAKRIATTLSGGERARAQLARILAGESEWILADEPFAGLDPAHQFEAADLLRQFASRGGGVILTIHDLTLAARIADRIVILDQGRVVADGTPESALTPATLRRVYGIEAQWFAAGTRGGSPMIAIHGKRAS